MNYLSNAFSLQMIPEDCTINKKEVPYKDIPQDAISCIGHADTAAVVANILGREIPMNRCSIELHKGDILYVAQVMGGRLPEGSTTLPEGFTLKFYKVHII